MSNLGQRLTVAAIGIPVVAAATWLGGLWFAAGLAVLAGVGTAELMKMLRASGVRTPLPVAVIPSAMLPLVTHFAPADQWPALILVLLWLTSHAALTLTSGEKPLTSAALAFVAVAYVGGLLSVGVSLRTHLSADRLEGTLLFLFPLAVTWLTDTAAYFGGRVFGRRPLAPRLSPHKTREGGVAGLAAGALGGLLYGTWVLPDLSLRVGPLGLLALGAAIAVAAILGDLVESAMKRECGVKDASALLPGHGGLLDRMDSLLWSIPIAYLLLRGVV